MSACRKAANRMERRFCSSAHRRRTWALVKMASPPLEFGMTLDPARRPVILVVEDVEETRDTTEHLLGPSGYVVNTARNEAEAVLKARLRLTDVILIGVGSDAAHSATMGQRIRER